MAFLKVAYCFPATLTNRRLSARPKTRNRRPSAPSLSLSFSNPSCCPNWSTLLHFATALTSLALYCTVLIVSLEFTVNRVLMLPLSLLSVQIDLFSVSVSVLLIFLTFCKYHEFVCTATFFTTLFSG